MLQTHKKHKKGIYRLMGEMKTLAKGEKKTIMDFPVTLQ